MKTFYASVGKKSLEYMKFLVKMERDKIIPRKTRECVAEMGKMAASIADANVKSYPETADLTGALPKVSQRAVKPTGDGYQTMVVMKGKNAVFIEFGAGKFYNTPVGTSPHPLGMEKGFSIGSYSHKTGKENAFFNKWYLPKGVKTQGGKNYTHGVKSWMPLHNAYILTKTNSGEIVKKKFTPPNERYGKW